MFTIEMATPQNQRVYFPPLRELLRGRWSFRALLGRSAHESLMKIQSIAPEIPGLYLSLDVKERKASRFDPLAELDAGRAIWKLIEPILRENKNNYGLMAPWEKVTKDKLSDDQIKLWLHWMRSLVESGSAIVVEGSNPLPSIETIAAMPGKRDNNPSGHKTPIPGGHFVDNVTPPGTQQAVAAGSQGGGRR